jgi:hypothetical protein
MATAIKSVAAVYDRQQPTFKNEETPAARRASLILPQTTFRDYGLVVVVVVSSFL